MCWKNQSKADVYIGSRGIDGFIRRTTPISLNVKSQLSQLQCLVHFCTVHYIHNIFVAVFMSQNPG